MPAQAQPGAPEDTRAALARVQHAWAGLLAATPGTRAIRRPRHLAQLLSLNPKLAWQVWRVAHAQSPLEALKHLPGAPGVKIALAAAREHGAPARAARAVELAMAELDRAASMHAGDRATLSLLVADNSPAADKAAEDNRRALFQALAALWGVQARAQFVLSILHPGREPRVIDAASVRGLVDLKRLRPDHPWIFARVGCHGEDTRDAGRYREPIEAWGKDGVPLLTRFCSRPLPKLRVIRVAPTQADLEIQPGPVGETGALTIVSGDVYRNLPRHASPQQPRASIAPSVLTPCESLTYDLLIHDGVNSGPPFSLRAYGDIRGEGFDDLKERNRLHLPLSMTPLGRGLDSILSPDIPAYRDLVAHIHEKLAWHPANFTAYRLRIPYPVAPSMVLVEFDLER